DEGAAAPARDAAAERAVRPARAADRARRVGGVPERRPVLPQRLLALARRAVRPRTLPARRVARADLHAPRPGQGLLPSALRDERRDPGARPPLVHEAGRRWHVRHRGSAGRIAHGHGVARAHRRGPHPHRRARRRRSRRRVRAARRGVVSVTLPLRRLRPGSAGSPNAHGSDAGRSRRLVVRTLFATFGALVLVLVAVFVTVVADTRARVTRSVADSLEAGQRAFA